MEADLVARLEEKERQLERYAADLRETFKAERGRAQELRASYMATVRALATPSRRATPTPAVTPSASPPTGWSSPAPRASPLADDPQTEFGFLLHDVGKVAVPDAILFKPAPLTDEERVLMERHPVIGWEILRDIDFLGDAKLVVRHHHERWDGARLSRRAGGRGHPARGAALRGRRHARRADDRPALPAGRHVRRRARAIIAAGAGTQFCPACVAALDAVRTSASRSLRDPHEPLAS